MLHLGSQTHTTVDLGTPVVLSEADRDHGVYILGKSGTGKSTFIENCMQQDAEQGLGFCLIEPHRDLLDRTLEHIPEARIADTVVIDLADVHDPVPFNVLGGDKLSSGTRGVSLRADCSMARSAPLAGTAVSCALPSDGRRYR